MPAPSIPIQSMVESPKTPSTAKTSDLEDENNLMTNKTMDDPAQKAADQSVHTINDTFSDSNMLNSSLLLQLFSTMK